MLGALKWVIGYALTLVVSVPVNGLLISEMWGWFVVPATGAREIGVAQGVGLVMFISVVGTIATAHQVKHEADGETDPAKIAANGLAKMVGVGILSPIFILAIAWAWRTFIIG